MRLRGGDGAQIIGYIDCPSKVRGNGVQRHVKIPV
jgi:hypothetical protein